MAESIRIRTFDSPDDGHHRDKLDVRWFDMGEMWFTRAEFQPGWRWSVNSKPVVGGDSCQVAHRLYMLDGQLHIRSADGQEADLHPGDAAMIAPGHDAWVVGDEPVRFLDFSAHCGQS